MNTNETILHPSECSCNVAASDMGINHPHPCNKCHSEPCCCNDRLRSWYIKYTVTDTYTKLIGQAYVKAHNQEEAQCVFSRETKFNGFLDTLRIIELREIISPCEPILVDENHASLIDRRILQSYPFLLKSEYICKIKELEDTTYKYIVNLREDLDKEIKEKTEGYDDKIQLINESITSIEENKQNKLTAGDNITINNNVISATDTKYNASDFDVKDLADSTNLREKWNDKQDKLTAGDNVSIIDNVISAVDTKYQASDFDIKDLADSNNLKNTWNNKQDKLIAGDKISIVDNVISSTGTDINDDIITNSTTWSSEKISDKISKALGDIDLTNFVIVDELPTENISTNVIYLIGKEGSDTIKEEYVYSDGNWVFIGDTEIDLSNYYTKAQVDEKLAKNQNLKAGTAINIAGSYINVKYDPNWLKIDSLGRLTLKYPIRYWDELDSGEDGEGGEGGEDTPDTPSETGNYLKQVDDLNSYIGSNGEIVQYVGPTNDKYINGYTYKYQEAQGGDVLIPAGTKFILINKEDDLIKRGTYTFVERETSLYFYYHDISVYNFNTHEDDVYYMSDISLLKQGDYVWKSDSTKIKITDISTTEPPIIFLEDGTEILYRPNGASYGGFSEKYINEDGDVIYVTSDGLIGVSRTVDNPESVSPNGRTPNPDGIYIYTEGNTISEQGILSGTYDTPVYNTSYEWIQKDVQPHKGGENDWIII